MFNKEEKKDSSSELLFKLGLALGQFREYMANEAKTWEQLADEELRADAAIRDYHYNTEAALEIVKPYLSNSQIEEVTDKLTAMFKEMDDEDTRQKFKRYQNIIWEALDHLSNSLEVNASVLT